MPRVKYFNCPNGCGAILKIRDVDNNAGPFNCPRCDKTHTLEELQPYKRIHKDNNPIDTSTQTFFMFKPGQKGKAREGAELYIDRWFKGQRDRQKQLSGKIRRRQ